MHWLVWLYSDALIILTVNNFWSSIFPTFFIFLFMLLKNHRWIHNISVKPHEWSQTASYFQIVLQMILGQKGFAKRRRKGLDSYHLSSCLTKICCESQVTAACHCILSFFLSAPFSWWKSNNAPWYIFKNNKNYQILQNWYWNACSKQFEHYYCCQRV